MALPRWPDGPGRGIVEGMEALNLARLLDRFDETETAALLLEPRGVVNTGDAGGELTATPERLV